MAPAFSKFAISVSFGVAGDSCSGLALNKMELFLGGSHVASPVGHDDPKGSISKTENVLKNPGWPNLVSKEEAASSKLVEDHVAKVEQFFNTSKLNRDVLQAAKNNLKLDLQAKQKEDPKSFETWLNGLKTSLGDSIKSAKEHDGYSLNEEDLVDVAKLINKSAGASRQLRVQKEDIVHKAQKATNNARKKFLAGSGSRGKVCGSGGDAMGGLGSALKEYTCDWLDDTEETLLQHAIYLGLLLLCCFGCVCYCISPWLGAELQNFRDAARKCCRSNCCKKK